ncbi:1-acyl-sn-glycerol-3-phosphate acyltransferase [Hymenobacter sp. 5516J-16]|uniref:1-acyl-sn-glycerol-3-phosphate acyltransferase n=1 Tax=Hymenobacter sp. 5516J-16 TaxID=2932253 RepID=UPI00293F7487|nr:1-acyl-sn-glycerol-3-phosphate acyltransferase [Hymenobacter sp. 5516J-16]
MTARKTSTFWYLFSKFWFKITGWRLGPQVPADIKKSMMIAAPHTSNWDFMFARAAFFLMDVDVKLTIKKEWTTIPVLGALVRSLGAWPWTAARTTASWMAWCSSLRSATNW